MKLRHDVVSYATFEEASYSTKALFWAGCGELVGQAEVCMRVLSAIGALAIVVGLAGAIYFFGGFYSVAGTKEDPAAVTWALTQVRTASINRHANHIPPASLNEAATVQAGARPTPLSAAQIATVRLASHGRSIPRGFIPTRPI